MDHIWMIQKSMLVRGVIISQWYAQRIALGFAPNLKDCTNDPKFYLHLTHTVSLFKQWFERDGLVDGIDGFKFIK